MTNSKKIVAGLLISFLLVSCNTSSSTASISPQAIAIHEEAVKMKEEVMPLLEELIQRRNQLSVQGRALTQEEKNYIDSVYALEGSFQEWTEKQVDASGQTVSGEGQALQLSSPKMLTLQQQQRDAIARLKESVMELSKRN